MLVMFLVVSLLCELVLFWVVSLTGIYLLLFVDCCLIMVLLGAISSFVVFVLEFVCLYLIEMCWC